MGGVVYSGQGNGSLGKIGAPIALGAGALIPPGQYYGGAWSANVGGTMTTMVAGLIDSDGQATLTAAGNIYPIGAGNQYQWPWRPPWPLPGSGFTSVQQADGRPC